MTTWIRNGHVLLFEPSAQVVQRDILIQNGKIVDICEPGIAQVADEVVDAKNKLVMPGLINAHTHIYMSLFRNYADDLPFHEWLFERILPVEDKMTAEDAHWSNMLSAIEMIRTGTTTFSDMHMFYKMSLRCAEETGLRAVLSRGLVCSEDDKAGGEHRLQEALNEMEAAKQSTAHATCLLGPHAIYTCCENYLRELVQVAKEKELGFHIHVSETEYEVNTSFEQHGVSPVRYLAELGLFSRPTLIAHGVYLSDEDRAILAKHDVSVAMNPISNMKLGNGFASYDALQKAGVNVCLGTDGPASNNSLNMFREMSTLSYIHKGVTKDAQCAPAVQVLRCATQNGARALGLQNEVGSLSVGKSADLSLIDLNCPQFQPKSDLLTGLVYSANGSEVDSLMVNGRWLMRHKELTTIDEERIYFEMERLRVKYFT